jgi:DNA-binding response OmpR family regulator
MPFFFDSFEHQRRPRFRGGATIRVLIVEDEPELARFVQRGLHDQGFAARVAHDGRSALGLAQDADFDMLVLDLGLPDLEGLDVLRELRQRGDQLPVIVLSARGDVEDKVAALQEGADDYLTKPFRFDELVARIRSRLRASGVHG